jgi:hypothetical protein
MNTVASAPHVMRRSYFYIINDKHRTSFVTLIFSSLGRNA